MKKFLPSLSLILSASTLICCALPALFVTLGAGATLVSLLGMFPQLVWVSEHKILVFSVAGICLAFNFFVRLLTANQCPTDPLLASQCLKTRQLSTAILYLSTIMYIIGGYFAFIAGS